MFRRLKRRALMWKTATHVQRIYRGWKGATRWRVVAQATLHHNAVLTEERGATRMQATWRGKVDRRKFRPIVIASRMRLNTTIWLQGMFRLKQAEDALKTYQRNKARVNAAASEIIKRARGVLVRKHMESFRTKIYRAASRINAGMRGRFGRKLAGARWRRVDDAWKWLGASQPRETFIPMLPKDSYDTGARRKVEEKELGHAAARGIFWDDLSAFARFDFAGTGKVNRLEFSKAVKVIGMALKLEEVTAFALLFPGARPGSVDYLSFIACVFLSTPLRRCNPQRAVCSPLLHATRTASSYARTQLYPCTRHYICPCPYCVVLKDCLSCHCGSFRQSPQPGICKCGHYKYAHTRHALPQAQPEIGLAPPSPRLLDPIAFAEERKKLAFKKKIKRKEARLKAAIMREVEAAAKAATGVRV